MTTQKVRSVMTGCDKAHVLNYGLIKGLCDA